MGAGVPCSPEGQKRRRSSHCLALQQVSPGKLPRTGGLMVPEGPRGFRFQRLQLQRRASQDEVPVNKGKNKPLDVFVLIGPKNIDVDGSTVIMRVCAEITIRREVSWKSVFVDYFYRTGPLKMDEA